MPKSILAFLLALVSRKKIEKGLSCKTWPVSAFYSRVSLVAVPFHHRILILLYAKSLNVFKLCGWAHLQSTISKISKNSDFFHYTVSLQWLLFAITHQNHVSCNDSSLFFKWCCAVA